MSKKEKLLAKVISGDPTSIRFAELKKAMELCGFIHERTSGSHQIMRHPSQCEPVPIQPTSDGMAKPYQVKQFRKAKEKTK